MPRPAPFRGPPAPHFRSAIEQAEQEGVARDDMTLKLTRRDASDMQRDRTLPVADISYAAGVMTFLGVKVETGGVETSSLDRGEA